jgi:hypothetical protein
MKDWLLRHKWRLSWSGFGGLLCIFVWVVVKYNNANWFSVFLQSYGLVLSIYPTVLIFVQSRSESDKALRLQLEHLQKLNQDEIDTLRILFQNQMDEFKARTSEQIQAIHESTQKQIEHYAAQTEKIVGELNTNSQLLAEILLRQLEEGLDQAQKEVNKAEAVYRDLSGFKLLRTKPEREAQLTRQRGVVARLKEWASYLQLKCNELHKYLGYDE